MAQGSYKKWIADTSRSVEVGKEGTARNKVQRAREQAREKSYKALMKVLHKEGSPTSRFWSRLSLQCLPTHSQMSKFAQSSS